MNKKTIKQELAFSGVMTFGMVLIMMSYNMFLRFGFSAVTLENIVLHFVPIYAGAFLIEQLIVNHNVQKAHKLIVSPDDKKFKQIAVYSLLMVTMMATLMTLYAALMNNTGSPTFWEDYAKSLLMNFPMALVAQFVVVGPLTRLIFAKIDMRAK